MLLGAAASRKKAAASEVAGSTTIGDGSGDNAASDDPDSISNGFKGDAREADDTTKGVGAEGWVSEGSGDIPRGSRARPARGEARKKKCSRGATDGPCEPGETSVGTCLRPPLTV